MGEKVAILDEGAQYGKVIDRRIRECNVESDLLRMDTPVEKLAGYRAIVISGGPESVYDPKAPKCDNGIFSLGIPILGICYGIQLMNVAACGTVEKKDIRQDGRHDITVNSGFIGIIFICFNDKLTIVFIRTGFSNGFYNKIIYR